MIEPIRKTIDVGCDADTAFAILTERISSWWPLDRHSVSAMSGKVARAVTLEPRVGGRVYETGADGEIVPWGSVTVLEPGRRIVIAWHIMVPESEATSVEVRFTDIADGRTRVDLEHRGWERVKDAAQASRDSYDAGWVTVFETCYLAACTARAA